MADLIKYMYPVHPREAYIPAKIVGDDVTLNSVASVGR